VRERTQAFVVLGDPVLFNYRDADLSPLHALKRTSTNRPDDGADQRTLLRIYAPSAYLTAWIASFVF